MVWRNMHVTHKRMILQLMSGLKGKGEGKACCPSKLSLWSSGVFSPSSPSCCCHVGRDWTSTNWERAPRGSIPFCRYRQTLDLRARHTASTGEREKRNSCYKSNHVIFIYLFLLPSVWAQPRKPRLISGSKLSLNPACNNIMSRLEKMSSTPHQTQAWQLSVCPAPHCDDGTTFSNTEAHESVMDCNTGSCIRLMRVMTLSFFFHSTRDPLFKLCFPLCCIIVMRPALDECWKTKNYSDNNFDLLI